MAYSKIILVILIILLFFPPSTLHGKSKLPVLATKQDIKNLRFISSDGKFTYYQQRSGSLFLSTNYNVTAVIKGQPGTQFNLYSTAAKKKIIIVENPFFHNYLSVRQLKNIYQIDYGKHQAKKIGEGVSPDLHLNDTWISYYNPYTKILFFQNLETVEINFKIKTSNQRSPYFIPQRVMLTDNTILYTDINNDDITGIISFTRSTEKMASIYKARHATQKIELCLNSTFLFIGQFGLDNLLTGSTISTIPRNNWAIDKMKPIYDSDKNDFGHLVCDQSEDKLYFIQNHSSQNGKISSEVVFLSIDNTATETGTKAETKTGTGTKTGMGIETKTEVEIVSDVEHAAQIINMDGTLLLPYRGNYYILAGKQSMDQDSFFSKKSDEKEK